MYDQLIQAQATAAQFACTRVSPPRLKALHDSVEEASRLPADAGWDKKAAAHAAFFTVLAEAADDAVIAAVLVSGGELAYDLMMMAGRAAHGIVINSRPPLPKTPGRGRPRGRGADARGAPLHPPLHVPPGGPAAQRAATRNPIGKLSNIILTDRHAPGDTTLRLPMRLGVRVAAAAQREVRSGTDCRPSCSGPGPVALEPGYASSRFCRNQVCVVRSPYCAGRCKPAETSA